MKPMLGLMKLNRELGRVLLCVVILAIVFNCALQAASADLQLTPPSPLGPQNETENVIATRGTQGPRGSTLIDSGSLTTQVFSNLSVGWNLVSLQIIPKFTNPADVFAPIASSLNSVWAYDPAAGWSVWYSPGSSSAPTAASSLTSIRMSQGLWLNCKTSIPSVVVSGTRPSDGTLVLNGGWNLVGFEIAYPESSSIGDIERILGPNLDAVNPANSKVLYVFEYGLDSITNQLTWLKYDVYNDIAAGVDPGTSVPIGIGNEPVPSGGSADPDKLEQIMAGVGYWVYVRPGQVVTLAPRLGTVCLGDADLAPLNNVPGPEDIDVDQDGVFDTGVWESQSSVLPTPVRNTDQRLLRFSPGDDRVSLVLRNAGTGLLRYNLKWNGGDWLTSETAALRGVLAGRSTIVHFGCDRSRITNNQPLRGQLTVETDGGTRDFDIQLDAAGYNGDFQGIAYLMRVGDNAASLPPLDFTLGVYTSGNGQLRGMISSDLSAHMGKDTPLTGYFIGSDPTQFVLEGAYKLPAATALVYDPAQMNPFQTEIQRDFVFYGEMIGDRRLVGQYYEIMTGMTPEPTDIEGNFELKRIRTPASIREGGVAVIPSDAARTVSTSYTLSINDDFIVEDTQLDLALIAPNFNGAYHPEALDIYLTSPFPTTGVRVHLHAQQPDPLNPVGYPSLRFPVDGPNAFKQYVGLKAKGPWTLGVINNSAFSFTMSGCKLSLSGHHGYMYTGIVLDSSDNSVIVGANVSLSNGVYHSLVQTAGDGSFSFSDIPAGGYGLSATRFGYTSLPKSIFVDADQSGVQIQLDPVVEDGQLLVSPAFGVAPQDVHLRFTGALTSSSLQFQLRELDQTSGTETGNNRLFDAPIGTREALFANVSGGIYEAVAVTDPLTTAYVVLAPNPNQGEGLGKTMLISGGFGAGGCTTETLIPVSCEHPGNLRAFVFQESMVDAVSFDFDRPPYSPTIFGPEDYDLSIATGNVCNNCACWDVTSNDNPPIAITFGLLPGDGQRSPPTSFRAPYRMRCNVGCSIGPGQNPSEVSPNGVGAAGGHFHFVAGAHVFPFDWVPRQGGSN